MTKQINILLALAILLASCDTYKRTAQSKHLAQVCADKFPVVNTEILIPGATIRDSIFSTEVLTDTFNCPPATQATVYRVRYVDRDTCISSRRVDTVKIVQLDSARLQVAWDKLTRMEKITDDARAQVQKFRRLFWWPLLLAIILAAYIFRKPIFRLITKF